jgi:hypothetical protein
MVEIGIRTGMFCSALARWRTWAGGESDASRALVANGHSREASSDRCSGTHCRCLRRRLSRRLLCRRLSLCLLRRCRCLRRSLSRCQLCRRCLLRRRRCLLRRRRLLCRRSLLVRIGSQMSGRRCVRSANYMCQWRRGRRARDGTGGNERDERDGSEPDTTGRDPCSKRSSWVGHATPQLDTTLRYTGAYKIKEIACP